MRDVLLDHDDPGRPPLGCLGFLLLLLAVVTVSTGLTLAILTSVS